MGIPRAACMTGHTCVVMMYLLCDHDSPGGAYTAIGLYNPNNTTTDDIDDTEIF